MADSLTPECTPLKLEYDACFNSWFEGYLEPAVAASSSDQRARAAYSKAKAEEYQQKCGKVWLSYRECIQKAIKEKGLTELLDQARKENPLKDASSIPSNTSS
ncbi:hypothetical protein PENSPDRAFT_689151 [Peniophora sp. CONT]|nr:hypothetical protein PENSPDRAFT_689151 [Peniophora sp. CONT]